MRVCECVCVNMRVSVLIWVRVWVWVFICERPLASNQWDDASGESTPMIRQILLDICVIYQERGDACRELSGGKLLWNTRWALKAKREARHRRRLGCCSWRIRLQRDLCLWLCPCPCLWLISHHKSDVLSSLMGDICRMGLITQWKVQYATHTERFTRLHAWQWPLRARPSSWQTLKPQACCQVPEYIAQKTGNSIQYIWNGVPHNNILEIA